MAVYAGLYSDSLDDTFGRPLRNTSVEVRLPGTTTKATLYTDRTKSATVTNPVTTDTRGNVSFYVEPGKVDLFANSTTVVVGVPEDPLEPITGAEIPANTITTAMLVDGAVTTAKIADATIVDADVSATAAIAQSKVAALVTDLADKVATTDWRINGILYATDPAYAINTGTGISSAERQANLTRLTTAISAAVAANKKLVLPARIELEVTSASTSVGISGSVWIEGHGKARTVLDCYPKTFSGAYVPRWFDVTTTGNHRIKLSDLTIAGPTAVGAGSEDNLSNSIGIAWWQGNTQGAVFDVDNVEITGQFGTAISRSGGGTFRVTDSEIDAYNVAVSFFESTGASGEAENAELYVDNCVLSAFDGYTNSVGIYIHPHIPFHIANTRFERFNRFGVYENSDSINTNPLYSVIDNCAFIDCSGIQTRNGTTHISNSVFTQNRHAAQDFTFYNNVVFSGCEFDNCPGMGAIGSDAHEITFNDCRFRTNSVIATTLSTSTADIWRFNNCEWWLAGTTGRAFLVGSTFTGKLYVTDGFINDGSTGAGGYLLSIAGGETWLEGLKVRNAKTNLLVQGSTALVHARQIDFHGAGATSAFAHISSFAANQVDGYEVAVSGTATSVFPSGVTNQAVHGLVTQNELDAHAALPHGGGGAGPTLVTKSADQTVNNSTAVVNDTALSFPIAASEVWVARIFAYYSSSTAADIRFNVAVPSGATGRLVWCGLETAAGSWAGRTVNLTTTLGTDQSMGGGGGGNDACAIGEVRVVNSTTAGTVQLKFAQSSLEASDTIMRAGSYIVAQKVS